MASMRLETDLIAREKREREREKWHKSLPIATASPLRSTALGVLFPELQEYIAPCPRLRMSPRLLLFL
jgi:hypothetical protein